MKKFATLLNKINLFEKLATQTMSYGLTHSSFSSRANRKIRSKLFSFAVYAKPQWWKDEEGKWDDLNDLEKKYYVVGYNNLTIPELWKLKNESQKVNISDEMLQLADAARAAKSGDKDAKKRFDELARGEIAEGRRQERTYHHSQDPSGDSYSNTNDLINVIENTSSTQEQKNEAKGRIESRLYKGNISNTDAKKLFDKKIITEEQYNDYIHLTDDVLIKIRNDKMWWKDAEENTIHHAYLKGFISKEGYEQICQIKNIEPITTPTSADQYSTFALPANQIGVTKNYNSGTRSYTSIDPRIQTALGVEPDGKRGPVTNKAIEAKRREVAARNGVSPSQITDANLFNFLLTGQSAAPGRFEQIPYPGGPTQRPGTIGGVVPGSAYTTPTATSTPQVEPTAAPAYTSFIPVAPATQLGQSPQPQPFPGATQPAFPAQPPQFPAFPPGMSPAEIINTAIPGATQQFGR